MNETDKPSEPILKGGCYDAIAGADINPPATTQGYAEQEKAVEIRYSTEKAIREQMKRSQREADKARKLARLRELVGKNSELIEILELLGELGFLQRIIERGYNYR